MIDLNIAIIEDDEVVLNRLNKILSKQIKTVNIYIKVQDFLDEIERGILPDLIISDINMSPISGLEMIKVLREKNIKIPVIIASAFNETDYFIEAIKLQVRRFLIKPIDIDILMEEIKNIDDELKIKKELKIKNNLLINQSKMVAMGDILSSIAHQWKQPLNTISISASSLQLLKELDDEIDDDEYNELVDNIINSVKTIDETIHEFQKYFKVNKFKNYFDLDKTFKKIDKLLYSQFKKNEIELVKSIEEINLYNYENELIQVLVNILSNAVEQLLAIDGRRLIIINVFLKEEDEIIIEIKDNGGGIKKEAIDKIFDSYYTTKDDKEIGMGLFLSKEIVEKQLYGEISVKNEEFIYDQKEYLGASFTIKLKSLKM